MLFVKWQSHILALWSRDLADCAILSGNQGGAMQRVVLDPIALVVCLGVALLLVWLWRRLTGR